MWCDRCRTDAAAEVSAETGRAVCANCRSDLGNVRRPATDQARELLQRWSAGIDLEAASPAMIAGESRPAAEASFPARRPAAIAAQPEPDPTKKVRVRRPATATATAQAASHSSPPAPPQFRYDAPHPRPSEFSRPAYGGARFDAPHANGAAPPHFDVHTAIATKTEARGAGAQIIGQILAYSGVLALTLGTALVIWGYFGGPPDYAPTGWLISTGGQMLLFLGVVTLVAGGLEQTSRDVRVRIESLGERLIRIENVATGHGLKGPHSPAAHYAGHDAPPSRRTHERV
ncbi:MAG: hypothetical protein M3552_14815 [Planctomycetota bacterium]|nr:hypothetical protein [Planctomycetaceae bacterium]MDQ3331901.1 hypothetical protein [Planctomycetota bacterium]